MQLPPNIPLLLLFFVTTPLALTPDKFLDTFRVDTPVNGPGGCSRDAPNGQYMLWYVIEATGDAFNTAALVQQQLGSYNVNSPSSKRLRGLLFLFFGITFGDTYQFSPDSVANYTYVKGARLSLRHPTKWMMDLLISKAGVFDKVNALLTAPSNNPANLPWFHCLEDYAFFTKYLVGTDILAAQHYNVKLPGSDDYYPGLMYMPALQYYYRPIPSYPGQGACIPKAKAFTRFGPRHGWGITVCPKFFTYPNVGSLGVPPAGADPGNIITSIHNTGGMTILHETMHLIGPDIHDQPRVLPPAGDYFNVNWLLWTTDSTGKGAYGFQAFFLGLAKPKVALLNADNYVMFALCLQYTTLSCWGPYTNPISKREEVPFQPAPEAVERIWQTESLWYGEE